VLPSDVLNIIYSMYTRWQSEYDDPPAKRAKPWAVCKDWMRRAHLRVTIPANKITASLHRIQWSLVERVRCLRWAKWGLLGRVQFCINNGADINFIVRWLDALQVASPDAQLQLRLSVKLGFHKSRKQAMQEVNGLSRQWTCVRTLLVDMDSVGFSKEEDLFEEGRQFYETFGLLFNGVDSYEVSIGCDHTGYYWKTENGQRVYTYGFLPAFRKDMLYIYQNADPWARPAKKRKIE